mmetsp:Transcript_4267/g.5696  ORF Transcript_4267/g.5696 Transcript_4267/m.5696 type:complete len:80 (+) Transcript_4267:495-734(+)
MTTLTRSPDGGSPLLRQFSGDENRLTNSPGSPQLLASDSDGESGDNYDDNSANDGGEGGLLGRQLDTRERFDSGGAIDL